MKKINRGEGEEIRRLKARRWKKVRRMDLPTENLLTLIEGEKGEGAMKRIKGEEKKENGSTNKDSFNNQSSKKESSKKEVKKEVSDHRAFITDLISKAKFTKKEIVEKTVAKVP